MESPNATTAPVADRERTSMAFNQNVEVVVVVKGVRPSSAVTSPEPLALTYDVTTAPPCWLGRTFSSGTYRLTARSCPASTLSETGSLTTLAPTGITTFADPLKDNG